MREVEYRAWDKELKRMCNVVQLGRKDIIVESDEEDEISGYLSRDRFILLQYTGLKDKNGKKIYESDIVKNEFYEFKGEVIYRSSECCYYIKSIENGIDNPTFFSLGGFNSKLISKLGNVYDNPELLEL